MTKTQLLYDAFDVPDRELDLKGVPKGTTCSITGEEIGEGVRSDSLLTSATAGPHEIFPNAMSDYCSWEAAQCYKYFKGGLTGNLYADKEQGWKPMVSKSSARRKERPCWQTMIYGTDEHVNLSQYTSCIAIFTEEFQRRLWIDAELSTVGPHWKPYLYYDSTVRSLYVNFERLQRVLALCEYVYSFGFTKEQVRTSLLGAMSKADLLQEIGLVRVQQLDEALEKYRGTDEMLLATFVCQRAKFDVTDDDHSQIEALAAPTDLCQMIPDRKTSKTRSTKEPVTSSSETQKSRSTSTQQMGLFN